MFCPNCGKDNPDSNKFCLQCGQSLTAAREVTGQTPAAATPMQASRSSGRLPLILGGVLLLVALVAGAYFLLPRLLGGGGGGSEMLLATPNRNNEVELSVLRLGDDPEEAVVIAEDVVPSASVALFDNPPSGIFGTLTENSGIHPVGGLYGGFLPGGNRLAVFYNDGGEAYVMGYAPGDEAPVEILNRDEDEDATLFGTYFPDSRNLTFIDIDQDFTFRCYVAEPGQEAERVARGGICFPSADGSRIDNHETNSAGELTVTLIDVASGEKITLLDDVEVYSNVALVSADASHVAYQTRNGDTLVLLTAAGEEVFESDDFDRFSSWGFAGNSDTAYFVGQNKDIKGLYTSAGGGPLAEAPRMAVLPAPDGATLAVMTEEEDGDGEVTVFNLESGASIEVASGDGLRMAMIADPDRLLVMETMGADLTLIAAGLSGANPVTLFDERDYDLSDLYHLPGDDRLLLWLDSDDGDSLYVAPLDGSPGFFAIEEWYAIQPLNLSGDTLLLTGREDARDDEILYALSLTPDAKPVELDDSGEIDSAFFPYAAITPDGRSALYNARDGNRYDDVVVRRVRLDGEEPPEDLYEGMALVDVAWAEISPFSTINYTVLFLQRIVWQGAW